MSTIVMQTQGLKGECSAKNYQNWIELSSVRMGVQKPSHMRVGNMKDRSSNLPAFSELVLTKSLDSSTNPLFRKTCVNEPLPSVDIHYCQGDGELSPVRKIRLEDVMITEHQQYFSAEGDTLEELRLSYSKITTTYIKRDAKGQYCSPDVTGYNLAMAELA